MSKFFRLAKYSWVEMFDVSRRRFLTALAIFLTTGAANLHAQAPVKVLFPYSVVNYSSLPWMIAKDAGLFRKHGLDVDLVFMGSSALIVQSMLSGAVPVAGVAGPAVISSVVSGGDVVTVANLAPLTIALMVKPTIEKPEDLRGKKIGVPRLGAVAHFAIRMILDRHGIKDATILQMGSQPEAAAGMRRDVIDGAMISLPLNYVLAKEGYRELVGPQDYRKLGIQFISQGISARKSFIAKNRDMVAAADQGDHGGDEADVGARKFGEEDSVEVHTPNRPGIPRSRVPLRSGDAQQRSDDSARGDRLDGSSHGRPRSRGSRSSSEHAGGNVLRQ